MAQNPAPKLVFDAGGDSCGDCGQRRVDLPRPLPTIGDDFDWLLRDYDSFRLFMLEELAGRFPERARWTPADIEVIFVESFAVVLDQLSDGLDRVHTEAFLDSARRPDSVRRLLGLIGYDAVREHYNITWSDSALVKHLLAFKNFPIETLIFEPDLSRSENITRLLVWLGEPENALGASPNLSNRTTEQLFLQLLGYDADNLREALDLDLPVHRQFATLQLDQRWYNYPHLMDAARSSGPAALHNNRRMVTLNDYRERTEDHPLVLRAASSSRWGGSWSIIEVVAVLSENAELDHIIENVIAADEFISLQQAVDDFHWVNALASVDWHLKPSFRSVINSYVDRFRMAGQEVWLCNANPVGLSMSLSVQVSKHYFQSEIRQAIAQAMGADPGGFFEPGKLAFGQDLYASDLIETLMALDGVTAVCLNQFKRVGDRYPDESGSGVIQLDGNEIGRCDNIVGKPANGYWRLALHGGQRG
jgi:hypothetical protein